MSEREVALSIKQPWATLIVHGFKSVEIRAWSTPRRGTVLIHAARVSDDRPEAWAKLPEPYQEQARAVGGIIGQATLIGCREYPSADAFAADVGLHMCESSWFRPPKLYGFLFVSPRVLPFRRMRGWMRFFTIDEADA